MKVRSAEGSIRYISNKRSGPGSSSYMDYFGGEKIRRAARSLDQAFAHEYTPLISLNEMADHCGVGHVFLKDESSRLGLNSFKGVGVAFAVSELLKRRGTGKKKLITASAGNHGLAVAWASREAGLDAEVFLPKGTSGALVYSIKSLGANVTFVDGGYDEAVSAAGLSAQRTDNLLIQDTTLSDYLDIPILIMQGYCKIFDETFSQLKYRPTHVFAQAGVGSFAGALGAYLNAMSLSDISLYLVEPETAGCFYHSIAKNKAVRIEGSMQTSMSGLACGTTNNIAYDILSRRASGCFACSDTVAEIGMEWLNSELKAEILSPYGPSGSVTAGLLSCLSSGYPEASRIREEIGLEENSVVLLFATEKLLS